ncbi:NAD(P)/FAD-dependent oxidoreductase [Actinomycetospora cinnamomea]|uniref:Geranylgeranyl reductase family protein n=1 Tax=Actinomycetospora cinnamomea TaxID=663609 RepID=A0A2U1FRK8_9PSEU|nr:geranylgeranyl reductase family protein [Actinomycetospora cinnamomea]PVZ14807.1 geranylgeranyl reductase family protein [Actinomycetospora cinnamomea]
MAGPLDRPDLAVVGAGPAGAAAALGALHAEPGLRVALLDRADFPRDKACGDGVAPHVLDRLAEVGVTGLLDDRVPVARLRLDRGGRGAERTMARPSYVVPRRVLDARLVEAAQEAGAVLRRHRVRDLTVDGGAGGGGVVLDGEIAAPVVVGADGARSVVRRRVGWAPGATALALRGYAPVTPAREGAQVIAFGTARQPSYAWSFDRGDGWANVGYGEVLGDGQAPGKGELIGHLEDLLPGTTRDATDWRGHHLPLSGLRWRPPSGRVLLVGDAAGLVNPMTGEGIYYAVTTGIAAGRAAARALAEGRPARAGHRYRRDARAHLLPHLRHTAAAGRLSRSAPMLDAGLAASARDQRVFDDLVELGLARGRISPAVVRGLVTSLARALLRPLPEER